MKKIFFSFLWLILCGGMPCKASALSSDGLVKINSHGQTEVEDIFGKTKILVKVFTHEVSIGKPSEQRPEKNFSNCTYARFPCSPVDDIEIFINSKALFVARSAYADLADVNSALLHKEKYYFVLTLIGGDASESYTIDITFDENFVSKRTLINNGTGRIMQETIYSAPERMD